MSRPTDWHPLAGSDPVPGDSHEVRLLAHRYGQTAQEIVTASSNLRRLASDSSGYWEAEAAGAFRDQAEQLAGKIAKAEDRYTAASQALTGWADDLDRTQAAADRALAEAKEAEAEAKAHSTSLVQPGEDPDPALASQEDSRKRALAAANDRLAAAQRALEQAVDDYHDSADSRAHQIKQVVDHDDVKDSFWDKVGGWIHEHAAVIKVVLKWIGRVAIVLATVALVVSLFVPGLNLFTGALLALTIASLIGHTALALTGDGNWLDVGLDVFGLATFGAGKVLGSLAKEGMAASRAAAAQSAAAAAREQVAASLTGRVLRFVDQIPIVGRLSNAGGRLLTRQDVAARAAIAEISAIKAEGSLRSAIMFGSKEAANQAATLRALRAAVPNTSALTAAAQHTRHVLRWSAALEHAGIITGNSTFVLGEFSQRWQQFADQRFTHPVLHKTWQ